MKLHLTGFSCYKGGAISPSSEVYSSEMFRKWNNIIEDRINYYTKKKSIAGAIANVTYKSIKNFKDVTDGWVLDIGCGDGSQAESLADHSRYIGLDCNLERLKILKKKFPIATAIFGDASKLPFKNNCIKYVYSSNAFEHIWYLKDAILDLKRCTTEDADIYIVIPTEGGLWDIGRFLISRPRFTKKYPQIDFDFISHVEHCNLSSQVARNLETFFSINKKYWPTRIPSIYLNVFVEIHCKKRKGFMC